MKHTYSVPDRSFDRLAGLSAARYRLSIEGDDLRPSAPAGVDCDLGERLSMDSAVEAALGRLMVECDDPRLHYENASDSCRWFYVEGPDPDEDVALYARVEEVGA